MSYSAKMDIWIENEKSEKVSLVDGILQITGTINFITAIYFIVLGSWFSLIPLATACSISISLISRCGVPTSIYE